MPLFQCTIYQEDLQDNESCHGIIAKTPKGAATEFARNYLDDVTEEKFIQIYIRNEEGQCFQVEAMAVRVEWMVEWEPDLIN